MSYFADVDMSPEPTLLAAYLDAFAAEASFQAIKHKTFSLLALEPGDSALDVGCGTGDDVRALAGLVGPAGSAVGVDSSRAMLAEAIRRGGPGSFLYSKADQLSLPDSTYHGSRAERVFIYIEDPRAALAEMIRVTRPGGRIVVSEPDWGSAVLHSRDRRASRQILELFCDRNFQNGWIGRELPGLFHELGLEDVTVIPHVITCSDYLAEQIFEFQATALQAQAAGMLSASVVADWLEDLHEQRRNGRFFCAYTNITVRGYKPRSAR